MPSGALECYLVVAVLVLWVLLSKILSLSLQRHYQCGSCSTTHSLRTYNVRETSEAFYLIRGGRADNLLTIARKQIKEWQMVYTSGEASPFDVNERGENVAHMCIRHYSGWIDSAERTEGLDSLKMMLLFLQQVGVEIYAGTDYDDSILEYIFRNNKHQILGPVYDVLANCEPQFDLELDHERGGGRLSFWIKASFLEVLHDRIDMMEGLGYRNLFLVVSKRDEERLNELIESVNFAEYVDEVDYFGQNILHFCWNWETGLRLLLEREATHHLVSQPDRVGFTPLELALAHSKKTCHAPCGENPDPDCGCSATVELLLETDCAVGLDLILGPYTSRASSKAMMVLFAHLGQRRERLRRLALRWLSESELRDLGVSLNELPDATAPLIWNKLQSLHRSGVINVLHNGLNPGSRKRHADYDRRGIFHVLSCPRHAEMALNVGFKGIDTPDEFGVTPILSSNESRDDVERKDRLKYADWLIKKGARLNRCTNSLGISAAHRMAVNSGKFVRYKFFQHGSYTQIPTEIVRVLSAMANNAAQSRLPCPWATEELSRPLHHFLVSSLLDIDRSRQFVRQRKPNLMARLTVALAVYANGLFFCISSDLDVGSQRKSIIGVLTMGALGIDHWPHRYEWADYRRQMGPRAKVEVTWDMLDEDRILIKQLGELVEEFAQELSSKKVWFEDFLRLHWLPRIRQVQRERKALREDRRRQLRQLGVVLDDEFSQDVYCNYDQDPDAWEDCFRSCPFEVECSFEAEDSEMDDWEVPEWE